MLSAGFEWRSGVDLSVSPGFKPGAGGIAMSAEREKEQEQR